MPSMLIMWQLKVLPPACAHKRWHMCNVTDDDCGCVVQVATARCVIPVKCCIQCSADGWRGSMAMGVFDDECVTVLDI